MESITAYFTGKVKEPEGQVITFAWIIFGLYFVEVAQL
jgi:hypothetical protein